MQNKKLPSALLHFFNKPEQGRWLRTVCRRCTSLHQKGTSLGRARRGTWGSKVPSRRDSWWWLAPWRYAPASHQIRAPAQSRTWRLRLCRWCLRTNCRIPSESRFCSSSSAATPAGSCTLVLGQLKIFSFYWSCWMCTKDGVHYRFV